VSKVIHTSTAEKLRKCRDHCGLSQLQVATVLGIDRSTYTGYESGRTEPNLTTIVKLADLFDVDVTTLLPKEDSTASLKDSDSKTTVPVYSLSKDEQTLVLSFRLLSNKQKSSVLAKITNMSKTTK